MVTSNQKHICKNLTQNSKQTSAFLTLTRFPKPRPELSENSMQHYYIKSASAFSVGSQHDATRICCRAPVSAAQRPHVSIDISCPQGAQQKTRRTSLLLSIEGTDRQTTDTRPLHRPCFAYYAGSVKKQNCHSLTLASGTADHNSDSTGYKPGARFTKYLTIYRKIDLR